MVCRHLFDVARRLQSNEVFSDSMCCNIFLWPFFCWRLLGLIPGGAPFSQLSNGVKDVMVICTKLVKCQFLTIVTKTCKRPFETTH